jgi:hypothetical protein
VLSPASSESIENTPSTTVYDIEELYVHAAGAMYVSSDIYGLASGPDTLGDEGEGEGGGAAEGGESSDECVICLTEAQEIFLLPCRCVGCIASFLPPSLSLFCAVLCCAVLFSCCVCVYLCLCVFMFCVLCFGDYIGLSLVCCGQQ